MTTPTYIHKLDGRLRIKIPEIKGSPVRASRLEDMLGSMKGVTIVKANPLTGNVLIKFEPGATGHDHILKALRNLGCLKVGRSFEHRAANVPRQLENYLVSLFIKSAVEITVKQLILALI